MELYNSSLSGEFSFFDFEREINKAKETLSKNNHLGDNAFENIRHSLDIAYTINTKTYGGQYFTDKIIKDGILIGHLDYFINHEMTFIEIYTVPIYNE